MEAAWISSCSTAFISSNAASRRNNRNSMAILSPSSFVRLISTSPSKTCAMMPSLFQLKSLSPQAQNPIAGIPVRNFSVAAADSSSSASPSQPQSEILFFRSVLSAMENVYLSRNPTAKAILDLVHSSDGDHVCYDHLAFRTFGVNGYGINSIAKFFLDFGYMPRDELRFPAKKLKALWFSPPDILQDGSRSGVDGPLPRIFISELLVDEMSSQAQEIISKYTTAACSGNKHAALASALGALTWGKPLYSDFQELSRESEYAAWTLVNGYAVNHVTISAHRLKSKLRDIKSLNDFVEDKGFKLNSEGGILKVSPDGFLLQSSTAADVMSFHFADGITETVPCSYIEFAERLVLPWYQNLPAEESFHTGEVNSRGVQTLFFFCVVIIERSANDDIIINDSR